MQFEFTGPGTHREMEGLKKFATLYGRVRSTLNGAGLPSGLKTLLWAEYGRLITDVENCSVTRIRGFQPMRACME